MKCTDTYYIAIEIADAYPHSDPHYIYLVDMSTCPLALENFEDDPDLCVEKILVTTQAAWITQIAD